MTPPVRGGLNLGPAFQRGGLGIGRSEAQKLSQKWRTSAAVEQEFIDKGFPDIQQPSFECPTITPELLSGCDMQAYTTAYVQTNSWLSYSTDNLAKVTVRMKELENLKKILAANSRNQSRQASNDRKRLTAAEQEDALLLNTEYQDTVLELQRYEQAYEFFKTRVSMLDATCRLISRQVEIRRQELDAEKSNKNNLQQRGYR